jgi:hypothetical protein
MVNFRKTLMVVASLALCATLASAAANPGLTTAGGMQIAVPGTFTAALVRSEGVTEMMPTVSFDVTVPTGGTVYDVTIISTAPITSKAASLMFNGTAASSISGNAATFSSVPFTADETTFALSGLRIDATQLPSLSSGQTTGLGENIIIIMSSQSGAPNAAPFAGISPITTVTGLAYSVKSLTVGMADPLGNTGTNAAAASFLQCNQTPFDPTKKYTLLIPPPVSAIGFTVTLSEGFGTAWQPKAFVSNTQPGEGSDATQGTQFGLTFTNVPSNVTLYVPVTYTGANGLVLSLVSPAKPTLDAGSVDAAVPASGVVVYEVTNATSVGDSAAIPVYVSYNSGVLPALTTSAAPLTVTGAYAPQSTNGGASGKNDLIPRFLGAAQSSHAFPISITPCSTVILFPYITNQPGYETGLAISNVGNLTTSGGQSGACQWNFYGDGAPTTAVAPTAAIDPGTTYAQTLSGIGVTGFTGFAVATCQFQAAYGYAYIADTVTGQVTAQGYLGLVIGQSTGYMWGFFPSAD